MRFVLLAALAALVSASPLTAQSGSSATDPANMTPLSGSWTYSARPGGSEADFIDADSRTQLALKCARPARQVCDLQTGRRPGDRSLSLWTSEMTRNVSATFNPSTGQVTALLNAYDPLLDALAFSRGAHRRRRAGRAAAGAAVVGRSHAELSRIAASERRAKLQENCRMFTSLQVLRSRE